MRFVDSGAAGVAYIQEVAGHADRLAECIQRMNLKAGTTGVWLPEWIPSERYVDFNSSVYWTSWESYPDTVMEHTNETGMLLEHLTHPANIVLIEAGPFALGKLPSWSENLTY